MTDIDTIKLIEKELNVTLKKSGKQHFNKTYTVDEKGNVTFLGLWDCTIKNLDRIISFLKDLPQLQSIDLRANQISDISFLKDLPQLQSLDLSANQISDYSFLKDLPQLQSLSLSANQISDYSFLKDLPQLQSLSLSANQISDISFLKDLPQLQSLDLSYNQISDISFLKDLPQLQSLYLSYNQISDYSFLKDLTQLQSLDLSANQISDISFLKDLTQLQTLYLSSNQISDYSFLKDLTQLQSLYLSYNQISDYSFLKDLTQLQSLYLSANQISDISFLKDLPQLQSLDLRSNQISDYSFLKDLTQLQSLYLSDNQISDISFLKDLTQLQSLYLSDNQISDISFLKDLTQLQSLDLRYNQISDISFLKDLTQLQSLYLSDNQIEDLPSWITDFNMEITLEQYESGLNLYGNPLKKPPVEIAKQGKDAIRDYFKSLEGKKVLLNEVKILLVGEGMAGKTSLLKQLQGIKFEQDESQTHGINVVSLDAHGIKGLKINRALKDSRMHFWDFGGQEIMHSSHKFFMSERSLYILVLDSRTDGKKYHWLKHIEKYGGDSPSLVVMNKIDANPTYNIAQKKINDDFPNIGNRFYRISCKTGEGMKELVTSIGNTIPQTSLFGTEINENWMNIKNQLVQETKAKRYISRRRFVEICEGHNVDDTGIQHTLLRFLHDLGVVLYFEKLNFANIYVLDPHWVTIGVYKIINSGKPVDGILNESDLEYILNKEKIKGNEYDPAKKKAIKYSPEEQRYIVDIMMQFELCYEYDRGKNQYIIPDLLPKELEKEPELNEDGLLCFVMRYDYLPSSIMARLMLRFKNDIVDQQQWKFGMILTNEQFECKAKVKTDEQNKTITITVQGDFHRKRDYFSAIRHDLWDIQGEFKNMKVDELIPLPGHSEHFVDYRELLGYEKAGKDEYFSGKLGKTFSVSEMLDSIVSREERAKEKMMEEKGNPNISITVSPEIKNIQESHQTSSQQAELTATQHQTVTQEVREVRGVFKNLVEDIVDVLDIEIKDEKDRNYIRKELEKSEKAFGELEQAADSNKKEIEEGAKNRLKEFFDNLSDENSRINKAIRFVNKGKGKVQKLARLYNKCAPYFVLPTVPPVLLGKEDSE